MPLIIGDTPSPQSPPAALHRLTWVALVSEIVLIAYWAFFLWTDVTDDLPEFLRGDGGYVLFGSIAVAFAAAVVTAILAVVGIARRRQLAPNPRNKSDVAVFVLALLLNPVVVMPALNALLN